MPPAIPLPAFRQPLGPDDPLPTVQAPTPAPDSPPDSPPAHLQETESGEDSRPEPLPPIPVTPAAARTRTYSAGDAKVAGKFVRGVLAILAGTAAALLARSDRHLRQPTPEQLAEIADPLGAILARHLPTEVLHESLIDGTSAAAAVHAYVLDGPLVTSIPTANVVYPEDTQ